ncbi:MAG TPA: hypothetical protein VGR35_11175 [Tepidisphaeraceae bacterium]|nr:hypothetical protein [Tepidisphaeraceae bacterium]
MHLTPLPVQRLDTDSGTRSLLIGIVRILAIGGIVMGLGVVVLLLEPALLVAFGAGSRARNVSWMDYGIPAFPYRDNTVYVSGASALLLVASSIAALWFRPWGRMGMQWYAIASIAHMLVLLLIEPLHLWYFDYRKNDVPPNFINGLRDLAVYAGITVTSLIYPVLILAVMCQPAVKALFQERGTVGFEPGFPAAEPARARVEV